MARIVPLEEPELSWARARFAAYYEHARVPAPPELARREFAAFAFGATATMRRHAALPGAGRLARFLTEVVPRHVYYSSAYYEDPAHPTMASKGWLGADLIFDLDADHLRGAESLGYGAQLALVKRQLKTLYDDFLVNDFGVSPSRTEIVFSGGRGYHVHVREPRFRGLSSPERRELVDYLSGAELDVGAAIREHVGPASEGARSRTFRSLAPPDAPGWQGRTTRGLFALLDRWSTEGPERAIADLEAAGAEPRKAREIARFLLSQGGAAKIREGLSLEVFPKNVPTELLTQVLRSAAVSVQGETDAPVTTDIHRLIRLPGSLHGGTGFRVVPVERDDLDDFDPFTDALAAPGNGRSVRVELREPVDHPFDAPVRGAAGDRLEVPEAAALFLVLRGEAALRP